MAAQIAIAFFGHNLVHAFERYAFPVLAVIFVIATIVILAKSHPGAARTTPSRGGFLLTTGAVFGYAPGGTPTRPTTPATFRPTPARRRSAGGRRLGRVHLLRGAGDRGRRVGHRRQRRASLGDPTGTFTGHLPTALADATLLAIALGAVCANVLNIYSGAMSFVAMGIRLPLALRRAIVALVFGLIGFIVALTGLHDAGAEVHELPADHRLLDRALAGRGVLRPVPVPPPRAWPRRKACCSTRQYTNWAGPVAMLVGVWPVDLAVLQPDRVRRRRCPTHVPAVGDITFEVGFVLTAVIYLTWHAITGRAGSRATAKAP